MELLPKLITGNSHVDRRGEVRFINDFDMAPVKRMYYIKQPDDVSVRGWRGHRIEQRWFNVVKGSFKIILIKIENWTNPNPAAQQLIYILNAGDNSILHIPPGYASAIKAEQSQSELIIFADHYIDNAKNDDYLYPVEYFDKID